MEAIVNLTQHNTTPEQKLDGVVDLPPEIAAEVRQLLTFDEIPSHLDMKNRAMKIAEIARVSGCQYAMIGGAPWFMSILEKELLEKDVVPCYSFSQRVVVEKTMKNGEVVKNSVFKHVGMIYYQ